MDIFPSSPGKVMVATPRDSSLGRAPVGPVASPSGTVAMSGRTDVCVRPQCTESSSCPAPAASAPAKQLQLISKQIRGPLAHHWLSVCAKRPGRSKSPLLHIASGLSPACPKTTDLSIKVLAAIPLWGGNARGAEDSLRYERSGPDPSGSAARRDCSPYN